MSRSWRHKFKLCVARLLSPFVLRRPTWIIGERAGTGASDNGYHLFLYCRDRTRSDHVYFVLRGAKWRELVDRRYVVRYGSLRHYILCWNAQAAIFNCDLRDCLPLELLKVEAALFEAAPSDALAKGPSRRLLARWGRRFKVNVSHGFEGLKNGAAYARLFVGTLTEPALVHTATRVSQQVRRQQFPARVNVVLTGVPRHDELQRMAAAAPASEHWVVALTFRGSSWHDGAARLSHAHHLSDYSALLRHPGFRRLVELRQARVTALVHHEYARDWALFTDLPDYVDVRSMSQGAVELCAGATLLITDYSSLAFDFLAMSKHVVFFWADAAALVAEYGEPELPLSEIERIGPVCRTVDDVVSSLAGTAEEGEAEHARRRAVAESHFPYLDQSNCRRCHEVVSREVERFYSA
jgi:hypothetical protein